MCIRDRAITVGRYLIPHAQAAFQVMGQDEGQEDARVVLAWIRRNQRTSFTKRDAFNGTRSRFRVGEKLDVPLGILESHEFIRLVAEPQLSRHAGRPASPRYETNPLALAHKPHKAHNSAQGALEFNSANSANCAEAPAGSREEADGAEMNACCPECGRNTREGCPDPEVETRGGTATPTRAGKEIEL